MRGLSVASTVVTLCSGNLSWPSFKLCLVAIQQFDCATGFFYQVVLHPFKWIFINERIHHIQSVGRLDPEQRKSAFRELFSGQIEPTIKSPALFLIRSHLTCQHSSSQIFNSII